MHLTKMPYHKNEERMVNRKMKNILLYADSKIKSQLIKETEYGFNVIAVTDFNNEKKYKNVHFIIVDADIPELNTWDLINKYKKFKTKFWAYTRTPSKENILKLYEMGFDNVVTYPSNINLLINNMTNPDNTDLHIEDAKNFNKLKKILLITDDKVNAELIISGLKDENCIFTVRTSPTEANDDIKKDQYNLVIIDCKTPTTQLFELTQAIVKSKLNHTTPYIFVSASKENQSRLKGYKYGAYSYIQKPYNIEIFKANVKNILEIKELQNDLTRENKLLDSLVANTINQSIITDSNFMILAGGNQHIHFKKNEYFFNFFKSSNIPIPETEIRTFSINTEKSLKYNFKYSNKIFETTINKVYGTHDILERYVIILEDITQKILVDEQKETFIATLTHDLKSPIRAEQTVLSQLLNEKFGALNDVQKEIIAEIVNSRDYTRRMIDNLLTRYKASSQNIEITPELSSYKDIISRSIKELEPIINEKKQEIYVTYKAKIDMFEFAPTEIKRVLLNLISNASEYTPKYGKIEVNVYEKDNNIITEVSDTGYGIDKNDIEHIFDRNVTLAKKYRKVGSGLGLYISKTLINAHGGHISVKSRVKEGSKFTFSLPKIQSNTHKLNMTKQ